MFSYIYPARFERDASGRILVTFPDLPGAATDGRDEREAYVEAMDCLAEALAQRMVERREIPTPGPATRGRRPVPVPLALAPKLALYGAMREMRLSNVAMARRLGVTENVVRRMLDPKHATRAERVQAALAVLGRRLVLGVEAA